MVQRDGKALGIDRAWRGGLAATLIILAWTGPGASQETRLPFQAALAEPAAEQLAPGAERFSLDGRWVSVLDPGSVGLDQGWPEALTEGLLPDTAPAEPRRVDLPAPLERGPRLARYDGVVWYARRVRLPKGPPGARAWLDLERINYACRVYWDGEEIGAHEGGYDGFTLPLEGRARGGLHTLVLRVLDPGAVETDGLTLATTPHAKESWYHNYGGVLGSITLVRHAAPLVELRAVRPDPASHRVEVDLRVVAPRERAGDTLFLGMEVVSLALGGDEPEGAPLARVGAEVRLDDDGTALHTLGLVVPEAEHWSPEHPRRYRLEGLVDDRPAPRAGPRTFGFRRVELDAEGFRLDGRRLTLHGVLYQPHDTGLGGLEPDAETLDGVVAEMLAAGFNLVRAHVRPAPEAFLDAADRRGLLVLEEPAVGWVDDDPVLVERLRHEVTWMVTRDHHHPSLVMWGILNELSGKAYRYGDELVRLAATLDPTRPVLEDSGGFFGGGRFMPVGGEALRPMHDEHIYPPFPLPLDERERMRTVGQGDLPLFISEFGYGTLPRLAAINEAFRDQGAWGAERNMFLVFEQSGQAALDSGEAWTSTGWAEGAARLQAHAASAMVEALRSHPDLDLLCYTQWQGVNSECSAGLLTPWGEARPAFAAVRRGLAPLLVTVFPRRSSVLLGEPLHLDVVVVNDTGAPREGELVVRHGAGEADGEVSLGRHVIPPGVTSLPARLQPDLVGSWAVAARLDHDRGEPLTRLESSRVSSSVSSRVVHVPVVAAPGDDPEVVWVPDGDEASLAFARRRGLTVVTGAPPPDAVALVARPSALYARLDWAGCMALWQHVWDGGAALVLLEDPSQGAMGRLVGGFRGVRTAAQVPVTVHASSAPGNFQGRVHAFYGRPPEHTRPGGELEHLAWHDVDGGVPPAAATPDGPRVWLLDEADASLSPRATLSAGLPPGSEAACVTVGPMGTRVGTTLARTPFGRGELVFSGVPLLDPVAGRPDPRRDRLLEQLVREAARRSDQRAPGPRGPRVDWSAFDPLDAATHAYAVNLVTRLIDLADRYSVVVGGRDGGFSLPPLVAQAVATRDRAQQAWLEGDAAAGRERLEQLVEQLWRPEAVAFQALEEAIIAALEFLVARGSPDDLDLVYETVEEWGQAVTAWFDEDGQAAADWLGLARERLLASGRLPPSLPLPVDHEVSESQR